MQKRDWKTWLAVVHLTTETHTHTQTIRNLGFQYESLIKLYITLYINQQTHINTSVYIVYFSNKFTFSFSCTILQIDSWRKLINKSSNYCIHTSISFKSAVFLRIKVQTLVYNYALIWHKKCGSCFGDSAPMLGKLEGGTESSGTRNEIWTLWIHSSKMCLSECKQGTYLVVVQSVAKH